MDGLKWLDTHCFLVVQGGNEIHPYKGTRELSFPFEKYCKETQ